MGPELSFSDLKHEFLAPSEDSQNLSRQIEGLKSFDSDVRS